MMRYLTGTILGALLALGTPGLMLAQHDHWEFNAHAGAFRYDLGVDFDDDDDEDTENEDTDVLLGLRLAKHWESGFGIGVNGDYIVADEIPTPAADDEDINVSLFLYSADLYYAFPSAGVTSFFLTGGIGAATTTLTDLPGADDEESSTDLAVPLGLGLKFHNDAEDPTWAIRIDVKDHLIWRDDIDIVDPVPIGDEDDGTEVKNNFELSGGISFFFGGGPSAPPPPEDTDGDGVIDERDQCPSTPLGTPVDSFGCPIPVDSDGDGVPDDLDQCPNTPIGAEVDANGCEIVEEVEAACADGRDWYRFSETISVDGRNWVKFGSSTTIPMEDLQQIGEYDGVPVYVDADARAPYTEAYVPLCAPTDTYQPYQVEQEIRGTTG